MLNIVHGLIIGLCINGLNVTFSTQDQRWRGERGGGDAFILDNSDSTVNRQQKVVKMVIPTPVCIPYSAAPANRHYGPGISLEKKARLFSQKIEYHGKEWHRGWIISTITAGRWGVATAPSNFPKPYWGPILATDWPRLNALEIPTNGQPLEYH